jgi:hypothetical protein
MQAGPADGASRGLPGLVSTVAPVQQVPTTPEVPPRNLATPSNSTKSANLRVITRHLRRKNRGLFRDS